MRFPYHIVYYLYILLVFIAESSGVGEMLWDFDPFFTVTKPTLSMNTVRIDLA